MSCVDADGHAGSETAGGERASVDVVMAVAAADGVSQTDLAPLRAAVDPEALDALVASMHEGSVAFTYSGYRITVAADGRVDLAPDGPA